MIWFEAEQILTYLQNLESQLDEWSLSALEMRMEKAELERLQRQFIQKLIDTDKAEYAVQLDDKIITIKKSLEERLKR